MMWIYMNGGQCIFLFFPSKKKSSLLDPFSNLSCPTVFGL